MASPANTTTYKARGEFFTDKLRSGKLIFQFDISLGDEEIRESFISGALHNRQQKDNYYVPQMEDELVFRAFDGAKYAKTSKTKLKHFDYILTHTDSWNMAKAKEALPSLWGDVEKLLNERKAKL